VVFIWQKSNRSTGSHIIAAVKILRWFKTRNRFFYLFRHIISKIFLVPLYRFFARLGHTFKSIAQNPAFWPALFFNSSACVLKRVYFCQVIQCLYRKRSLRHPVGSIYYVISPSTLRHCFILIGKIKISRFGGRTAVSFKTDNCRERLLLLQLVKIGCKKISD